MPGGAQPAVARPDGKPKDEDDKKEPEGKEGEKKPDGDESGKPKVITRPEKPPQPPNPDELEILPGPDGKIRFNFRGQPWTDVLDWLARVAQMSLDWQELPGDYLNLTTQRGYTVDEAKDLINRHLLARGFTLLENDEILSVAKISNLNPGLVPRVSLEGLDQRRPHEFVKVSFALDWLLAEDAVEELKPMLSPNGTLTPLKTTNRVEAMDAVVNLREIAALLRQEQSDSGQDRLVKEFELQYIKAADVVVQLEALLGIESKSGPTAPMSRQQMEMMRQQQQMMAQMQQQQRGGKPSPTPPKKEAQINLVVNTRKNSILAHAPPDKMAIIEQAVRMIDMPSNDRNSLLTNPTRMQVYRLHALDPEPLVKTLQEIGELEPATRLEVDQKNKVIIAYASLADHVVIRQLVDRLDGSGRRFEVIPLRRLAADYVAGTIEFMMVGQEEENERPRYYDYYSYRYGSRNESESQGKFRVDADVENNRLLLWASDIEIEEVMNLLVKLGEVPPDGQSRGKIRVLEAGGEAETAELLEQLRRAWPSLAPNPLILPPAKQTPPSEEASDSVSTPDDDITLDQQDHQTARSPRVFRTALLNQIVEDSTDGLPSAATAAPDARQGAGSPPADWTGDPDATQPAGSDKPPINVTIGPDGRLVVSSDDTAALDLVEEVIAQLTPPVPEYTVFRLKYADAFWVQDNLEAFFEEEDEDSNDWRRRIFFYDPSPRKESEPRYRLSRRPKLKFIYDYDTNSILVQGADRQQLKTIEELIEIYDQPLPDDAQTARLSAVFPIQYSKAEVIAEAIKEVYRDLLSSNDKALQNPEQRGRPSSQTMYLFNQRDESDTQRTQANFKGKLSLGVDPVSNTLLVSCEGETLLSGIEEMVRILDQAAEPASAVSVVSLSGKVNAERVREVLNSVLSESTSAPQGQQQAPQQAGPQPGQQPPGRQGRAVMATP
jgi:type II secretory pathway component GspD/PulD (secretin)